MDNSYHRLFVCLMPEKNVRDQARDIQRKLSKFSYKFNFTNLEQVHLTIKFLGNRISTRVAESIIEDLRDRTTVLPQVTVKTEDVQFGFHGQKKPNVIYITTQPNPALDDLIQEVQNVVKQYHPSEVITRKDKDKFLSHFTIGRVKKDISKSQVKQVREILDSYEFSPEEYTANELFIIKSTLTRKGPVYSVYDKIPLKKL